VLIKLLPFNRLANVYSLNDLLSSIIKQRRNVLRLRKWRFKCKIRFVTQQKTFLYICHLAACVSTLKPNTHRRRRRDWTVELRRVDVGGVYMNSQLAHDDCRRIRSTILETKHSGLTTWILIDIDNFFNNDVITSSLFTNLNSSTPQEIVNWSRLPTGAFTPPTQRNSTSLLANLFRLVETVAN